MDLGETIIKSLKNFGKTSEELTESLKNLNKILDKAIEWMKNHPEEVRQARIHTRAHLRAYRHSQENNKTKKVRRHGRQYRTRVVKK